MSPETLTALIAAGASLVVALVTAAVGYVTKRRSDDRIERLEEARAERDAERDYRYEARKRLYHEFQPLFFQLVELSEAACGRIAALARTARHGNLDPGPASWLNEQYFRLSTAYVLLAPIVVFRLCQRRLTLVDLSVDPQLRHQYTMAKALHSSWDGFRLAGTDPPNDYRPHDAVAAARRETEPEVYALQHIVTGKLDRLLDSLVVGGDKNERCMGYGEFEEANLDASSPVAKSIPSLLDILEGFHPRTRPVLWRILLAQAHIHRALGRTFYGKAGAVVHPAEALSHEVRKEFDWRKPDEAVSDSAVDDSFEAVQRFLRRVVDMRETGDS